MPTQELNLVKQGKAAKIYVDPKGKDYAGLRRVAQSFAADVKQVTEVEPEIHTQLKTLDGTIVIAGSIGSNELIDRLIAEGTVDVSAIQGKRECYRIQVVEEPTAGVDKALVIVGSDKRGTMYGIYSISEKIGVSPWKYWADVIPEKKADLILPDSQLHMISKEPSVKYRGLF